MFGDAWYNTLYRLALIWILSQSVECASQIHKTAPDRVHYNQQRINGKKLDANQEKGEA